MIGCCQRLYLMICTTYSALHEIVRGSLPSILLLLDRAYVVKVREELALLKCKLLIRYQLCVNLCC